MNVDQNPVQSVNEAVTPSESVEGSQATETVTEAVTSPESAALPVNIEVSENVAEATPAIEPEPETAESAVAGAEIATDQPAGVQSVTADDQTGDPVAAQDTTVATPDTPGTAATTLDDTAGFPGDEVYIKEVGRVIREEADKPYVEEADSEAIQKDYLAKRFDVHIGKDKE